MKGFWGRLGGQLGIGFCVVGFVVIFLGWNGAAGKDRIPSQFPFLISGGVVGLAIILIGVGVMVIQSQRSDRAALESALVEIRRAVELLAAAGSAGNGQVAARESTAGPGPEAATETATEVVREVVAGPTAYHRPDCRLLAGREALPTMTVEAARAQGLSPCRVCEAFGPETGPGERPTAPSLKRRS